MYFTIISYYFFENKFVIINCTRKYNINSTKTHPALDSFFAYLDFIRAAAGISIIDNTFTGLRKTAGVL